MPQLNPAPWFFILILSWATILFLFKTKLLLPTQPTNPKQQDLMTQDSTPWNWPWT